MATAESTGPCYAPDDPTLPKPWVGLMDGSSSLLYYWNPETNVTQYEKPVSLPPPLPSGPPPTTSTPKLAQVPTPHSMQLNGVPSQSSQQFTQSTPQQVQQFSQLPLQNGQMSLQQQVPNNQGKQQHGSQMGQVIQQQGQLQHSNKQMLSHMGQQMPQQGSQNYPQHPGQQMQQQDIRQVPQHVGQQQLQHQNPHMQQPHGQQYTYPQQLHYMANHRSMPPQGQQNTQAQVAQGLQFTNQPDYKAAVSKWETVDFHQGNQTGFPPTQFQQAATNSVPTPLTSGHMGLPQQFSGVAANMQQPAQMVQSQQNDLAQQQYGLRFPNQMGSSMMHRGYENSVHGRPGADHYFNAKMEGPAVSPHQLKLAPLSMSRNQQDSRAGTVPLQNVTPGYAGDFTSTRNMHSHGNAAPPLRTTDITGLSPTEIYCQEHEVTATGDNVPAPFMTFESGGLPPEILQDIRAAGFLSPTPIQAQTWPIALQSRDIVAIAKTGSGKTLGYLIPAFILLQQRHNNPQNGPTVLVLAPTRELATQIQDEVIKFGRSSRVSCTCLYGGAPKGPQLRELERGADIVVATPGRLNDILEMKKIDFRQVSLLVLDEADRMLDMGFEPQIRKIVNEIPPWRQTLMYTATWPKEVRKIAADLLVNPVQVNIGRVDELAANKSITQYVEVVSQMEKERRLEQIIRSQVGGSKIIIFCSTKRLCDQLARNIGHNFPAAAIHGDKSQGERDWVLNQFRSGKSPILVATDVAARGLDIKDIRVVINYDFPNGIEDYVHRIGRTGRAGATGVAYTFLSEQDWKHTADLVKVLEGANQNVPPEVREMVLRGGSCLSKGRGGMNRFDSGNGGGRWDSGGRGGMRDGGRGGPRDFGFGGQSGMRDGNFGVRGGMRDGNFGGHGGSRDGNFGGHGGSRDGNFGGHGGSRDSPFNNHAGRNDSFGGRGNRGRGFGGPGGSHPGWRNDRGLHDRFNNMDGRGRGRGRFDGRREVTSRSRGRSYSRSPERVRTWDRGRSRSRSHSRSSRSRSRSRSWTRSRSRSRSRSRDCTRTHSRSPSRSPKVSRSPKRARSRSQSPHRSHSSSRSQFFEAAERLQEENNDAVMNASTLPDAESHKPGLLPGAEQLPVFEGTEEKGLETPEVADLQSVAET